MSTYPTTNIVESSLQPSELCPESAAPVAMRATLFKSSSKQQGSVQTGLARSPTTPILIMTARPAAARTRFKTTSSLCKAYLQNSVHGDVAASVGPNRSEQGDVPTAVGQQQVLRVGRELNGGEAVCRAHRPRCTTRALPSPVGTQSSHKKTTLDSDESR